MTAMFSFMDYLGATLKDRRQHPRDDMFTDLVNGEIVEEDGEPRRLTLEQAVNFAALIGSAGTETVARMLGWAALTLDNNPEQRAELAADSSAHSQLRGGAAALRGAVTGAEPLVHRRRRRARRQTLPARSKVVMITGSAGRDERAYPDADRFDIHRNFDHHLSFGYGIHFCLGAALARTEGRIALEETFKRFPEWSVEHGRARCRSTPPPSAGTPSSRSRSDPSPLHPRSESGLLVGAAMLSKWGMQLSAPCTRVTAEANCADPIASEGERDGCNSCACRGVERGIDGPRRAGAGARDARGRHAVARHGRRARSWR